MVCIRVRRGTIEETIRPGFVIKYLKVNIVLNNPSQTTELSSGTSPIYLAAVHFLDEHPHKEWFGPPAEVWQKVMSHEVNAFIPIRDIICRCAYVTRRVQFNPGLEEEITAVVPINYFAGLL